MFRVKFADTHTSTRVRLLLQAIISERSLAVHRSLTDETDTAMYRDVTRLAQLKKLFPITRGSSRVRLDLVPIRTCQRNVMRMRNDGVAFRHSKKGSRFGTLSKYRCLDSDIIDTLFYNYVAARYFNLTVDI